MPLALLLQQVVDVLWVGTLGLKGLVPLDVGLEITGALGVGGNVGLSAFIDLVRVEETLIDRARSAFLVHWFGTNLPFQGRSLRVVIDNIVALDARFTAVLQASRPVPEEPNLADPLAGIVGNLVGIAASPSGVVLLTVALARLVKTLQRVGTELPWYLRLPFLPLTLLGGGALTLAGAPPLAFVGAVAYGIGDDGSVRDGYRLLGAVAGLLISARGFLELLVGPRENIKNPLLLKILGVLDRFAALVPFLFAFVAFVVTRLGALLDPLARQLVAFAGLFGAVFDAVGFVAGDLQDRLKTIYDRGSPLHVLADILSHISKALRAVPKQLKAALGDLFDQIGGAFALQWELAQGKMAAWLRAFRFWAVSLPETHPLHVILLKLKDALAIFGAALDKVPPPPSTSPPDPDLTALQARIEARFKAAEKTAKPTVPTVPSLPDPDKVVGEVGGAPALDMASLQASAAALPAGLFTSLELSEAGKRGLRRLEHPPSVFARTRAELEKAHAAFLLPSDHEKRLREVIFAVTDRLLPTSVRDYAPKIHELFAAIDANLDRASAPAAELPVKELAEGGELRPVVKKLRLLGVEGSQPELRAFAELVKQALVRDPYLVPAS